MRPPRLIRRAVPGLGGGAEIEVGGLTTRQASGSFGQRPAAKYSDSLACWGQVRHRSIRHPSHLKGSPARDAWLLIGAENMGGL
jgi:hypothetical protein